MSLTVTILGCGSSAGVPRIGNNWGDCDPGNPKNNRRRCSILVQKKTSVDKVTNVLVDTTPDMRTQLLGVGIGWVDGVLYTHDHADHIHGIDDLRTISFNGRARVDVYADEPTSKTLQGRFAYCFEAPAGTPYPPILNHHLIEPAKAVAIDGEGGTITSLPFSQQHGGIMSLGYRFGGLAYSSDLNDLPDHSLEHLQNLDVWIVDALKRTPHPTHFSLDDALGWIERLKPKRAILTNMFIDMDYETLVKELSEGVEPAYDGMVIDVQD